MKNQQVVDYFADKNVLILGNSVEIMNHDMGEWIDSHDIVCRCGAGLLVNDNRKKAIGEKVDVWFTGLMRSYMWKRRHEFEKHKELSLILYYRGVINYELSYDLPEHLVDSGIAYDMYTQEENVSWMRGFGSTSGVIDDIRPSMGLSAIKYMIEHVQSYKKLTIYGFDFFKKYTKHPNPDPSLHLMPLYSWHLPALAVQIHPHNHEKEISYVNKWIDQGLLEWKMMSDLKSEKIINSKYGKY